MLDLVKIGKETPLDIGTDGVRLIVAPGAVTRRYGLAFEKPAK